MPSRPEGPYYNDQVHVLQEKCSSCVFRPGNKMHLESGRLADLVRSNIDAESALQCHQTLDDWPNARPPAVCRGFYDSYRSQTLPLRAAEAFGIITFDPTPMEKHDE